VPKAKSTNRDAKRKLITPLDLDDERDRWRFIATLAALRDRARGHGVEWMDAWAAYQLAHIAIKALAGVRDALAQVRRIDAFLVGADGPDSDALAIIDLARIVGANAFLRKHRNDPPLWPGQEGQYAQVGRDAPGNVRQYLVKKFGESKRTPSVDDLTDWLERHADKRAPGKLTTAGIVGRIVHRGRLLAAHHGDEAKTIQRVGKVLRRHATPY
jgi:hypothetical protein